MMLLEGDFDSGHTVGAAVDTDQHRRRRRDRVDRRHSVDHRDRAVRVMGHRGALDQRYRDQLEPHFGGDREVRARRGGARHASGFGKDAQRPDRRPEAWPSPGFRRDCRVILEAKDYRTGGFRSCRRTVRRQDDRHMTISTTRYSAPGLGASVMFPE